MAILGEIIEVFFVELHKCPFTKTLHSRSSILG